MTSTLDERQGSAALRNGLLFGGFGIVVYIGSAVIQDITGTTLALATEGTTFRPLSLLNQTTLIVALGLFLLPAGERAELTRG